MHNVFFSMPALSLKLPIPILWVFFVLLFRLIFPIKEQSPGLTSEPGLFHADTMCPAFNNYRGSTISFIAVLSSPSISISVNAGTDTRSIPPGATKPRAIAIAFTA